MGEYTLPHKLLGEQQRLALMSALLDPVELAHIARLELRPGWRCLEVGCGNGSIARALAQRVAPAGHVVASDIDLGCIVGQQVPCLEVRRIDILQDAIEKVPTISLSPVPCFTISPLPVKPWSGWLTR
jgi:2-polyprenyl-3-methyl-5-hydroxy-6-metoxy-1,4-benzoquinol methylase